MICIPTDQWRDYAKRDSIGKQLLQQTATPFELQQGILLDLDEMNEGVYFLNTKTEAGTRVIKVARY